MKDNFLQKVSYSVEGPGVDPKATRTGTVTGYNVPGDLVYLKDEDGTEHKLEVGRFLVRAILEEPAPQDAAVAVGLIASAPAPDEAAGDARRLSETPVAPSTRRRMGARGAPDHGSAAAQPDEFAKPAVSAAD